MFRGQHKHSIDGKGRLSIPARFRDALESDFEAPLYVTVLDGCLVAYPADEWRVLEAQLNSRPQFDKVIRRFRRVFYSPAQECPLDKAGRILLPPSLREQAGLEREAILAGMGKTFEIWSADRHQEMMQRDLGELEEIFQGVGDIGL